jgi:outer membrane protein, adhesin transport system
MIRFQAPVSRKTSLAIAAFIAVAAQANDTPEFGVATSADDAQVVHSQFFGAAQGYVQAMPAILVEPLPPLAPTPSPEPATPIDPGFLELREWLERIEVAVERHPAVRAQAARRDGSFAAINEARAALLPQVTLSADSRSQRSVRDGQLESGPDRFRVDPSLSARQLVFDGGAQIATIDAARQRATVANLTLDSTAQAIALRAARTMADLARLQQQRVYAENNLKEVRRLRNMIEQRVTAGRDSPSEMPRMESRVSEALISLSGIEANLKAAQASHEEVFGEPPLVLALPSYYVPVPETDNKAIDLALRLNADLMQAESAVAAARFDLQAQKAGRWPSISLEASATGIDSSRQSASRNYDSFVGLEISQQLFDGGSRDARMSRAAQLVLAAEQQLSEIKAQLISGIRAAYANRESLFQRYQEVQTQQMRDRETQQSYEEQFLVGRRPLNDLITAQRETYSSALQQASIEAEVHLQHFIIRSFIGDLRELAKSFPNWAP